MARKKQFQTRLDPDAADAVESLADEQDISDSEALRRLVRAGLRAGTGPSRTEIAADLDEIREEIRSFRAAVVDDDDEPDTTTFHQMNAKYIGLTAVVAALTFWLGTLAPF